MSSQSRVNVAMIISSIVVVAILGFVAVVEYTGRQRGVSPVRIAINTVKAELDRHSGPAKPITPPEPDKTKETAKPKKPGTTTSGKPVPSDKPAPPEKPAPTEKPAPAPPPPPPAKPKPADTDEHTYSLRRTDHYVPGNSREWLQYGITVDKPTIVRAGGELRVGSYRAGPDGVRVAPIAGKPGLDRSGDRAVSAAPYLALLGRVCSNETCSPPFVIGSQTVLCPARLGVTGDLQLWTNNYVKGGGFNTLESYSTVAGGYRFAASRAPEGECAGDAPVVGARNGNPRRSDNMTEANYSISSRQTTWKPFFFSIDRPLVIKATGAMSPARTAKSTGPAGIAVTSFTNWRYPGSTTIVLDAEHVLLHEKLPYQALIGRLCGPTSCGEPFLIGSEKTICPNPKLNDRLELWVNHIIRRSDGKQNPFDEVLFQSRRGEYLVDVSPAPAGSCSGS